MCQPSGERTPNMMHPPSSDKVLILLQAREKTQVNSPNLHLWVQNDVNSVVALLSLHLAHSRCRGSGTQKFSKNSFSTLCVPNTGDSKSFYHKQKSFYHIEFKLVTAPAFLSYYQICQLWFVVQVLTITKPHHNVLFVQCIRTECCNYWAYWQFTAHRINHSLKNQFKLVVWLGKLLTRTVSHGQTYFVYFRLNLHTRMEIGELIPDTTSMINSQ